NAAKNKKLSDDRAKAVMADLISKEGIGKEMLSAKGWGSEKPIADNTTEEGREKNRRVGFLGVEQDVTQRKVEIDPATGRERVVEEKKSVERAPAAPPTPATPDTAAKPDAPAKPGAKPKPAPKPDAKTPAPKPAPTAAPPPADKQ